MKKLILSLFTIVYLSNNLAAQQFDKKIEDLMDRAVDLYRFNGTVLVTKKGKTIFEKSYGYQDIKKKVSNTQNTIFQVGSTTKQFTATLILKLAEQHKLSLDDKINKYFPDFKRGDEISITQLLSHTSGIPETMRDPSFISMDKSTPISKEKLLSIFVNKPLNFEPGTQYSYCNSGYILLGLIIEKVSGKPYEHMVRETIFKPLKMIHSGFDFAAVKSRYKALGYSKFSRNENVEARLWDSTATFSAGSLYTTAGDLYLWHKGLLDNKLIKRSSLEKAYTPVLDGYGLGCFIDSLYGRRVISHGGNIEGFTSYFGRIQEDDICVILLNNIFNVEIEAIGTSILAILYNQPYHFFDEIKLSTDVLDRYVGNYEVNTDYYIKITRENDRLFAQLQNAPKVEIVANKVNSFFVKDEDMRIKFYENEGTINKISINRGLNTKKGDKVNM
jgi:CubicO group peptidase (beta-lactamase class C family)